ncbi:GNAT family N-acetyltransferase [Legionella pneumophila]|nr:GNAT family N-acetyltransferase [Legionella pneumophila]
MTDTIEIIYTPNPSSEEIQSLYNGIAEYAQLKKNQPPIESFGFFIYDDSKTIMGGCNGAMYYGCLYIDSLWIDESLRHKNIGTRLIESAEALGKERGCLFSTVNTMDWEALGFYQKMGYAVEYERTGYFHHSTLYFLRKSLR